VLASLPSLVYLHGKAAAEFLGIWSIGVFEHFWGGYDSILGEAAQSFLAIARRIRLQGAAHVG
jgi:hypothetical protein